MNGFVVDASIAVKWVNEEPETEYALALRRRPLAAPDLLVAECANILWKKAHRGEISPEEAVLAAFQGRHLPWSMPRCRWRANPADSVCRSRVSPGCTASDLAIAS